MQYMQGLNNSDTKFVFCLLREKLLSIKPSNTWKQILTEMLKLCTYNMLQG